MHMRDTKQNVTAAYLFSKTLNPEEEFVDLGVGGTKATRRDLACLEYGIPITKKLMNFAAKFFHKETGQIRSASGYVYITHDFVVAILNGTTSDINDIDGINQYSSDQYTTPTSCIFQSYIKKNLYNVMIDIVHKEVLVFDHVHTRVVSEKTQDIGKVVIFLLSVLYEAGNPNLEERMSIQDLSIKFNTVANGPFSKEDSGVIALMLMRARNNRCQIDTSDTREMGMKLMMEFLYNFNNLHFDDVFAAATKWYKVARVTKE